MPSSHLIGSARLFRLYIQLLFYSNVYCLICLSEYLHPVLCDEHSVLELGGPAVVGADGCPVVPQHQDVGAALTHPRLYREGHPGQHSARVRVPGIRSV